MVAQILAVTIFVAMFVLIVIDKIERQYITLGCGVITLVVVFGLCMHSVTAITDTLNIHSIFTRTFWYTGGAAEESSSGINWADNYICCRNDGNGRRNGKSRLFQMALHENCQTCTLQDNGDFYDIYDYVSCIINVYRQHYCYFVPCSSYSRVVTAFKI